MNGLSFFDFLHMKMSDPLEIKSENIQQKIKGTIGKRDLLI